MGSYAWNAGAQAKAPIAIAQGFLGNVNGFPVVFHFTLLAPTYYTLPLGITVLDASTVYNGDLMVPFGSTLVLRPSGLSALASYFVQVQGVFTLDGALEMDLSQLGPGVSSMTPLSVGPYCWEIAACGSAIQKYSYPPKSNSTGSPSVAYQLRAITSLSSSVFGGLVSPSRWPGCGKFLL